MTATLNLLSLSGATLREGAPTNPAYAAELARRMAKREAAGKVTVAALRSWGRTDEANAIKAAAKAAKPAPAPKVAKVAPAPVVAPTPAPVAFTRTEVAAKGKKPTLTTRMDSVEQALIALAANAESQNRLMAAIVAKLTA